MALIYNVSIQPADTQDTFRISWQKKGTNQEKSFQQTARDISPGDVEHRWQNPRHQIDIGSKLFRFLDGDQRFLHLALDEALRKAQPLHLDLCACKGTADWPFELLARDGSFLLPDRLHLVRCVSQYGAEQTIAPGEQPLKLLFMACSARDTEPELDFEKEEEAIFKVTQNLAVDMQVEDSGSLEGLREQMLHRQYDVVHLSGHAGIDEQGNPFFIMEDETGERRDVSPVELWEEALIENPPRLLFLSGCRTGEAARARAAVSFARRLVEQYHVPAVLGWGRPVSDDQASRAEEMLYRELSRGRTIPEAVQRARHRLIGDFPSASSPAWPLLRLFGTGTHPVPLVKKGQRQHLAPRQMVHTFLKNSRVQVLAEGFVGRRRQLQQSLRVLNQDLDKVGLLLLGTGGLGKSCLAGKISERLSNHTLVVVHGKFNAYTLEPALEEAFIQARDEEGKQILAAGKEMTEKLAELCAAGFKDKNYLILLDDFEQNIEGGEKGRPGALLPEAAQLLNALLRFLPISGKSTQVLITSRYRFSLTLRDRDLVKERLESVYLTGFREAEQQKKARELTHIFYYGDQSLVPQLLAAGHGNPRLMEWLDVLAGQMAEAEVPQLLEAISGKQEKFIKEHVIRELLERGGKELARLLRWLSIYRQPAFKPGVGRIGETAGLTAWQELVRQGIGFSLIEYDGTREQYRVTPLLREEFEADLEDPEACHEAAFAYYEKECADRETMDPVLTEEWIYHALGCGREEVASRQGGRLVKNLRERLAFRESQRVGEWVLAEKQKELSTADDAFLLNELAGTIYSLGDHRKAIEYFERALNIWKKVYGENHTQVAIALNNLGVIYLQQGDREKAKAFLEKAYAIFEKFFGPDHHQTKNTAGWLKKANDGQ